MNTEEYLALSDQEKLNQIDSRLEVLNQFLKKPNYPGITGYELKKSARTLTEMLNETKAEIPNFSSYDHQDQMLHTKMAEITFKLADEFIVKIQKLTW